MEYRVRRADGRYGWMLDTGAPRYTDGGEFIGYIGSCIDITERKEAEVARATLEQALSQGMEGLALMDELGAFVYMNRTYAEMYGFTVSDLMGKTWKELYDPDQIAVMEPHISVVLNTYAPWRGELVGRKKTGRYFYVEVSLQRLKDVQYADASLACGCRDITERKWAEAALRESEERYALALRGSNDGHWDWSIDTNYCYLSPRWKELLGFDDHEIADHNDSFFERLHPDDLPRVRAAVQAHVIHRAPYNVEVRLRHKTGGYRWFRSRGQAMWNANGQAIRMAGVLTDITEHKQAQEALRTAHDDLEARVQIRTAELTAANAALAQQIAERQRAEEALLKSHSLFRAVAAVSPVGIYRTDPAGRCVYANERCSEMTGLAQEAMHGEGWAHALHPDDRARVREAWRRAVCLAAPFRD
jgi:PAS domain S-box-containing protein